MTLSEKLVELKEKIAQKASEIDRSKGKLSMLHDDLKKMGFKDIQSAKIKLKDIQTNLHNKQFIFKRKIVKLENMISTEFKEKLSIIFGDDGE